MNSGYSKIKIEPTTKAFFVFPIVALAFFLFCAMKHKHRHGRPLKECPRACCDALGNCVSSFTRFVSNLGPRRSTPTRTSTQGARPAVSSVSMQVNTTSVTTSSDTASPGSNIWFTPNADGAPPTYAEHGSFDPIPTPPIQSAIGDPSLPPPSYEEAMSTNLQDGSIRLPKEPPPKYESVA